MATIHSTGTPRKSREVRMGYTQRTKRVPFCKDKSARHYAAVLSCGALFHEHTVEQDSQADLPKQIIASLQEIFGGGSSTLTEHCQSNFILFTNMCTD